MKAVTMLTDASLCVESGTAAWAAAIIWKDGERICRRILGGVFRGQDWRCINAAEIAAVANAFQTARAAGLIKNGDRVGVVADNLWVVRHYNNLHNPRMRQHSGDTIKQALLSVSGSCGRNGIRLEAHKVKAHTLNRAPAPDDNSWAALNHIVDTEAKRHMRNARDMTSPWRCAQASEAGETLVIKAASDDPLSCLHEAWNSGIMEARHVRWVLERLVAEERIRFPEQHAGLNIKTMKLPPPPPGDTPMNWLRMHYTPEEAVAAAWSRVSRMRESLNNTGEAILAMPEYLQSMREHLVKKASFMGYAGVQFDDGFFAHNKIQNNQVSSASFH